MIEQTLVIIKPDAVARRIMGPVLAEIECARSIVAMHYGVLLRDAALYLYRQHAGQPYFYDLLSFTIAGPTLSLLVRGENVVSDIRELVGPNKLEEGDPSCLRRRFGLTRRHNCVHCSDSPASAAREIALWRSFGYFKTETPPPYYETIPA